jgi:anti-anti-sigma factor
MDSSGMHLLLEQHRRASRDGGRFAIIDGQACVARPLELCSVYDIFDREQTESTA